MLLIEHKIWHGISPEGYRQVFTKTNQNYICQQGNILLDNLRVLDLVRMSRSHVKGHRRGGVCVLRMLLVIAVFYIYFGNCLLWFQRSDDFGPLQSTMSELNQKVAEMTSEITLLQNANIMNEQTKGNSYKIPKRWLSSEKCLSIMIKLHKGFLNNHKKKCPKIKRS